MREGGTRERLEERVCLEERLGERGGRERHGDRERERDREKQREKERPSLSICIYTSFSLKQREKDRQSEGGFVRLGESERTGGR